MSKLPLVASIYNPQNQNREQLIESFVVRIKTFKKIFKEIAEAKMKHPEQHYLIVGKRGMGKTTLLLRLAYEIEKTPKLNSWLIPLVFNEEEYSIWKLYKFWIRAADLLEDKEENHFYGLSQQIEDMWEQYDTDEKYEKAIFEVISNALKNQKKKIILFIDNVGDMFYKFSDHDAHRLRKILQTSADIRIIAASSKMIESFFKYDHPFYEFFKQEQLKGLNQKETEKLLMQLGETYQQKEKITDIIQNQKGRVESLRRLTGGVIRTIVLLFEIFIDSKNGSAFNDLEAILDRVTPLYKHRMDDLSKQQQEIVEAIALAWDAVSVKEIKQKTRMESKVISAQLGQLIKNDIVNRIPTSTKNHFYQISERFFNIWYLMRHGKRGDKRRVLWLIRFLEEWCDEQEIVDRAKLHISNLDNKDYNEMSAFYLTEAIAFTNHIPLAIQHELLLKTKKFLSEKGSDFYQKVSKSDIELLDSVFKCLLKNNFEKALDYSNKMKNKKYHLIGGLYLRLGQNELALEAFHKGVHFKEKYCHNYLGDAFLKLKKYDEAEKQYLLALENNVHSEMIALLDMLDRDERDSVLNSFQNAFIEGIFFLISKNKYELILEKIGKEKLSNYFKPLYYALMYYLQDKYPNEYLRMGDELKETVEEIIAEVERMREEYN